MRSDFVRRHIGPGESQITEMLATLGLDSLDDLVTKAVPDSIVDQEPLDLPPIKSERATLSYLREMSERNRVFISMIGMGYYGTVMPKVILRNVMENPGWYTAYTPYQAEVSQGRLEVLLNYQQMVLDLTGMELANASLLDEATAAAEAMAMANRVHKGKSNSFFVAADCHPQTIAVVETRARSMGLEVIVGDPFEELSQHDVFGLLLQYPGTYGDARDYRALVEQAHEQGALVTVASDLLALCLLTPPGEWGADIVVGNSQRFGVPMGYGGPHAAFFATREAYKRSTPGRLIGVSVDAQGRPALRMALQTREQHIRREKATSNICTAQVLLAIIAALYAIYHGPDGLKMIAGRVHRMTQILAEGLRRLGYEVETEAFFDTIVVRTPGQAARIAAKARESRINLRFIDANRLGISFDETVKRGNLQALWRVFATKADRILDIDALDAEVTDDIPETLSRTSEFLTHPVFQLYHAETEMLRYLRWLAAKDVGLDRSMIPLGSCTMKLNATTEMIPVTWRQFSAMHPFAPLDQTQGYQQLAEELEEMLCAVTGFEAISFQPNAGSQGEYSGLLTIRKYHESRGEGHRDVCLIPASAHGTNPASAHLAGLRVVVVNCDEQGNVDMGDLEAKVAEHADNLAALMITYPSTHGVYEESFVEICKLIHDNGGQVYLDGANLNALLGICRPGTIGADVAHMNLHKTFCIPHGGGGPGMGPTGALSAGPSPGVGRQSRGRPGGHHRYGLGRALGFGLDPADLLGLHRHDGRRRPQEGNPAGDPQRQLHQAPPGAPLPRALHRQERHGGPRMHHRPARHQGVERHLRRRRGQAPGGLRLPRADHVVSGGRDPDDRADRKRGQAGARPLLRRHDPDPPGDRRGRIGRGGDWTKPYTKEQAFFPLPALREDKYWPPVGRVDNVYGDRHLVCACPPMEAYRDAAE
jgi:glycine dehydrogenase